MDDNSKMPFGKYKGTSMIKVPASYLLFIREQDWIDGWWDLRNYIDENIDALKKEIKEKK